MLPLIVVALVACYCLSPRTESGGGWTNPGGNLLITRHMRGHSGNPPAMLATLAKLEKDILDLEDTATSIGREDEYPSDEQIF